MSLYNDSDGYVGLYNNSSSNIDEIDVDTIRVNTSILALPTKPELSISSDYKLQIANLGIANSKVNDVSASKITSGTFGSGSYTFPANLTVQGDFYVNGETTVINTTQLAVEDSLIRIGSNAPSDLNSGLYWSYLNNTLFGGLVKEGGSDNIYLLSDNNDEPTPVSSLTSRIRGNLYVNTVNMNGVPAGSNTYFLKYDNSSGAITYDSHIVGDVFSSLTSTVDNRLCRFDTTTGKLIQDCLVVCDDSGNLTGVGSITASSTVYGSNIDQNVSTSGQPLFLTVRSGSGISTILLSGFNTSILLDGHYGNSPPQQLSYYCDQKDGFYIRPIRSSSSGSSNILTYDTSRYEMMYTTIENISGLTTSELNQLRNIDSKIISTVQWGYLSTTDQNLSMSSNVSFNNLTCPYIDLDSGDLAVNGGRILGDVSFTGNISMGSLCTVDNRDISEDGKVLDNLNTTLGLGGLTTAEVNQLKNIDSSTVSNTQWQYLSALDQNLSTGDTVNFHYANINRSMWVNESGALGHGLHVNNAIVLYDGDLKLTTGNIVLSQVGATVDGIDLTSWKSDYDSKVSQAVLTSSSPSFINLTLSGNLTLSTPNATVDGIDLTSWKSDYDSKINQGVLSSSSPTFSKLNMTNVSVGDYSWNDSPQSVSVGHYSNHYHTSNVGYISLGYAVGFQGALGTYSVNIGNSVAYNGSGTQSVSIGFNCNPLLSGNYSTSVGAYIGSYQAVGANSTNLGYGAGLGYTSGSYNSGAGAYSTNLGFNSAYWGSGSSSVNIGNASGSKYNTPIRDNSICINATGNELSCPANSSCVIKPLRNTSTSNNIIQYDATSGELTHNFACNQNLLTTSDVQFDDCKLTGNLTLPSTGGTASNLSHYEEYNLTSEPWTIFGNTPTTDINITRIGRMVVLCIAGISLTSSGVGNDYFEIETVLPSRFRPIRDITVPLSCGNNSSTKTGILTVYNSGNIIVNYDITLVSNYGSGFNNNFVSTSVSYNV